MEDSFSLIPLPSVLIVSFFPTYIFFSALDERFRHLSLLRTSIWFEEEKARLGMRL